METKKSISFRLLNIVTEQFATFEIDNLPDANDLQTDLQFSINPDNRLVACKMKFQFLHEKQPIVVLTVICNFDIEESSWNSNVISGKKITLPKHFLEHLCVITVGTSRGILHTKTENTTFNRFIIPTLNVSNLVAKDVVFEIK
ncbi:hypothetical protein AX766_12715 [Flavobacterium covae]|uniref:Immunity protein 50 n=1 Tax=Flavobacterium covae TaxID=2906076 RepID=A0ABW8PI42_9FLAO|nr:MULTISPECIES: hypothetical protein [Flavobacterium]AND65184.1 hypothetical protein AX766_12715 [Flavobacterium covae]OWP81139.1 hypothetical protein BWK63_07450 [Flavobacterium covae]POR22768.1 hypothetical protein BWK57_04800 [Flavobacterium columnare]